MHAKTFSHFTLGAALAACLTLGAHQAFADDHADTEKEKPQAEITFPNVGGISGWQPDRENRNEAIYIQGSHGKWYHATTMGYCPGLSHAEAIAFADTPTSRFDRFSSIIVDGRKCQLKSLVESERPGKKSDEKEAEEKTKE